MRARQVEELLGRFRMEYRVQDHVERRIRLAYGTPPYRRFCVFPDSLRIRDHLVRWISFNDLTLAVIAAEMVRRFAGAVRLA